MEDICCAVLNVHQVVVSTSNKHVHSREIHFGCEIYSPAMAYFFIFCQNTPMSGGGSENRGKFCKLISLIISWVFDFRSHIPDAGDMTKKIGV